MNPKGNFAKGNKFGCFKRSKETKNKMSLGKLSEKNPNWKGDEKIHVTGLHIYVRYRLPEPEVCPICKIKPPYPYDLANITGVYNRDLINWQYQCRRCHMNSDGRIMHNLKQFRRDD